MSFLTQEQWTQKLKRLVPDWWFAEQSDDVQEAIFAGAGAVFSRLHEQAYNHYLQTRITDAEGVYLDAHGDERNVPRFPAETDDIYQERIRNIVNSSNPPAIQQIVDLLLIKGSAKLIEHAWGEYVFADRESFLNRAEVFTNPKYNTFTIIVENQLHDPYSFFDREYFLDREDAVGTTTSDLSIFERIVDSVNKSKAFGVLYRLLERDAA